MSDLAALQAAVAGLPASLTRWHAGDLAWSRGLGLGAAASLDALHALRSAGATTALVGPRGDDGYPVPRRVYARLGFRPVARTVTWVRG